MAQCSMCGKIIKPGEKLCNSCNGSSNAGLKVEVDTMPEEKLNEIEKTKINKTASDSNPKEESVDPGVPVEPDGVMPDEGFNGADKRLPLEEDLITVEHSPFDDFSLSDEKKPADPDEPLEMSSIEDEIEPNESTYPDFNDLPEVKSKKTAENIKPSESGEVSTDRLYVMPDEMVSSKEREKLIDSLHSKIPNIMKQKQTDEIPEADEESEFQQSRKELAKIAKKPPEPEVEPKTQILPTPTPRKNDSEKESTAYFKGTRIVLPPHVKFSNGEEINIHNHKYILKNKSADKKGMILLAILGAAVIMALALAVPRAIQPSSPGQLIGITLNSQTKAVIPDAQVILDEIGETVYSDENGIFRFENVKKGDWSVSASKPQYKTAAMGFSLGNGRVSVLTLSLDPSVPAKIEDDKKNSQKEVVKEVPIQNYGKLTVIANTPGAKVIVDSKMLGPGNKTYSNITSGKHKLVVMAEGYKEYSSTVEIKRNQNNTVDVDLEELDVKYKPSEITFEQYMSKADDMAAKGNWREAAGNYTLALAKREDPQIYYKRSTAYAQMGQNNQAQADMMKASRLFIRKGNLDRGIDCLNKILDNAPQNTEALRERGFARLRQANYDGAIDDLKQAVDINEDDYNNLATLGEAYYLIDKPKDALKYLKKARKLNESDARIYALCALASMARGDEKDAEKYYKGFELRAGPSDRNEFSNDPEWQKITAMISEKD